jgi:hypothetical protein
MDAKPFWDWNNVKWPELYIANPYFELAKTGFFICQPTTEQECETQAEAEWYWWGNDYQECRISPTEKEACLELPNLHYNDIVDAFWVGDHECWGVIQKKNGKGNGNANKNGNGKGKGLGKRDLVKRGMHGWRGTTSSLTHLNAVFTYRQAVGAVTAR